MIARYDAITSSITQSDTHFVEPVVFGTTDPQKIACLIDTFCQEELGAHVANYLFYQKAARGPLLSSMWVNCRQPAGVT